VRKSDLPPLIRALLRPQAYSQPAERVELIQTHVSFVLLAGDYAYKIKKPVNFGFLNFSTLARRRYYCRQEVVLNSRLCSDTYLGVVPIREAGGRFAINGSGRIVEYAVWMRRLPAERMMDRLLANGEVTEGMLEALACRLEEFHAAAGTSRRIAEYGDWAIRYAWGENIRQWAPYVGQTVSPEQDAVLRAYGEAFFARRRAVLKRRVKSLRIRECHSDLRSDAVCFVDGICIFDCVEFNRRIRLVDVARDVGFLAMDLDFRGHSLLADRFAEQYLKASGDDDVREIIDFYKCYNACVRGKVDGFRLSQPEIPAGEKRRAQRAAGRYFDLACQYAASLRPALLVITCGLPASGQSRFARKLSARTGLTVISSDIVRKRLAGIAPGEHRYEEFGAGLYASDSTERTYEAMIDEARAELLEGRSVILDAAFLRRRQRRAAMRAAKEAGAQFACLEISSDGGLARKRLERRQRHGRSPSDARWEIYAQQKRRFQKPSEIPGSRRIRLDDGMPLGRRLTSTLAALRAISPLSLDGSATRKAAGGSRGRSQRPVEP